MPLDPLVSPLLPDMPEEPDEPDVPEEPLPEVSLPGVPYEPDEPLVPVPLDPEEPVLPLPMVELCAIATPVPNAEISKVIKSLFIICLLFGESLRKNSCKQSFIASSSQTHLEAIDVESSFTLKEVLLGGMMSMVDKRNALVGGKKLGHCRNMGI